MYKNHQPIVKGLCIVENDDGSIVMCDKVKRLSGLGDAVPAQANDHSDGFVCESYAFPSSRLRIGRCPLCSIPVYSGKEDKPKLNPIKASKRKQ